MPFLSTLAALIVAAPAPRPLIIDTDMDLDDAMAILFSLRDPSTKVAAITVAGDGFCRPQFGVPNAMRLTKLAGQPRLPVAYGAIESLSPIGEFPMPWRVSGDNFFVGSLPGNPYPPSPLDAPALIIKTIKESREKVDILAIAPLTNVATAIHRDPSIVSRINAIYFSGGAVDAAGNVFGTAAGTEHKNSEWNVFLDAVAAANVFASGARIVLTPTDATDKLPLYKNALTKLKNPRDPVQRFIRDDVDEFYRTVKGTPNYWDPAAAVLLAEDYAAAIVRKGSYASKRQRARLTVDLNPGPNYGRTRRSPYGHPVEVVLNADLATFERTFYEVLNR